MPQTVNPRHVLALISSVVFLAVINGNMINVALPYIGKDFAVTEGTYGWVVTGYSLAFGIFNAVDGRLADVLGTKRLYLIGLTILGGASLAVAASPTIEWAIAIRVLQGAGAAALPVLGSSIIAKVFEPGERGAAMGVILSVVGVAASIGPFLGGIIVQFLGWRFCFAFTGVVLFAIPAAMRVLPKELNEVSGKPFDAFGAFFLSAGVALLLYSFTSIEESGFGAEFFAIIGAGFIFLIVFWIWVHRHPDPFADPKLLKNIRYIATCWIAFLINATRFGTIVLVPIFLTEVNELEPIWIGAVLFPGAVAIAVISRRAGALADRVGPRRPVSWGTIFIVLGNLTAAYFAGGSPIGVAAGMGLYGAGFALIQSPLVAAASQIAPKEQTGTALGLFMMIFFVGGAFGVAVSVTATELQAIGTTSWAGFDLGGGAIYSNAIFVLTGLALLSLCLVPFLPSKDADQVATH